MHQRYADQGVRVVGIHQPSEDPDLIADFAEQTGVTFPLVPDEAYTLGQFAFPPGVNFPYPRDVVVDKNGIVRSIKNSFSEAEMVALIEELLAE